MSKEEIKKELTELILRLNNEDYVRFCNNYSICSKDISPTDNQLKEIESFMEELQNEEEVEEIISEIHFNTETEY